MPSCCNSAGNCTCKVVGGSGATITGIGTLGDPLVVSAEKQAINHGSVSGTYPLDATYGLHEMTLTGNTTLAPSGPVGEDMSVLIHANSKTISLSGATWYTAAPGVTADNVVLTFAHFPTGWYGFVAEFPAPSTVTPATPTFTAGSNTITIPTQVGVRYLVDGGVLAAGAHPGYPAGAVLVVAEATSGYVIADGATASWPYTFGPLTAAPTAPDTIPNLAGWWDVSNAGSVTTVAGPKISAVADIGPNAQGSFTQATDSNRPGITTVNGKNAALCDTSSKGLSRTSFPAGPMTGTEKTTFMVVRMDSPSIAGLGNFLELAGAQFAASGEGVAVLPAHIRSPNVAAPNQIRVDQCWTTGTILFLCRTVPTSGASTLYVGARTPATGTLTTAGSAHGFQGASVALTAACEWGAFSRVLTGAEVAGLYSYAKAKWNTA